MSVPYGKEGVTAGWRDSLTAQGEHPWQGAPLCNSFLSLGPSNRIPVWTQQRKKYTSGCWEPDKVCLSRQNQNSGRGSEIQSGINVCSRKYSLREQQRDSVRHRSDAAAVAGFGLPCWLSSETTSVWMSGTELPLPGYFQESGMGSWQLEEQSESCGWPVSAALRFLVHFSCRRNGCWPLVFCVTHGHGLGQRYFGMSVSVYTNSYNITPTNLTLLGGPAMCQPAVTPTCVGTL